MEQLTVRVLDDELSEAIRHVAQREGVSLDQAALRLLRKGAGLSDAAGADDTVGSSLDHLIGSWTPSEADEFDAAIAELAVIDEAADQHFEHVDGIVSPPIRAH